VGEESVVLAWKLMRQARTVRFTPGVQIACWRHLNIAATPDLKSLEVEGRRRDVEIRSTGIKAAVYSW
jgi:hypothetical protein